MKIDPDNYDLRELRRIADERRSDRNGTDDGGRRRGRDGGRPPREDARRPRDRSTGGGADDDGFDYRDGRDRYDEDRGYGDADRYDRHDGYDDYGADPRGHSRRDDGLRRPYEGYDDHARAHDQVRHADFLAGRYGLGGGRRDGGDRGYDELGYERRSGGRGYDFEEVGKFRFDQPVRDRPRGRAGEALRNNQLEQLLIHETAAAGGSLEKPYLSEVPKEYAAERVVFDWLEFLVLKGGFKRTMDALRYYYAVEWITEEVEVELHDYLIGFSGNVSDTSEFDVDDHHLSLLHVAQLASMAGGVDEEPTIRPASARRR
ncbi:FlaD/FlaE family flagellar protein [Halogeometricum luteum]|uniref:Flagellar protein d/e n=1 Tax=Halogeometricum luteum TaxID=2950537 RepID=A0ABU2FX50_9EURY|nr:FlaD/FlaE family flagellar protein [Halogeometricum sp. S3BR5-2]MDS0293102.1 flagellar protein d/e [Halogeometricum sp. S3BR5-2]